MENFGLSFHPAPIRRFLKWVLGFGLEVKLLGTDRLVKQLGEQISSEPGLYEV